MKWYRYKNQSMKIFVRGLQSDPLSGLVLFWKRVFRLAGNWFSIARLQVTCRASLWTRRGVEQVYRRWKVFKNHSTPLTMCQGELHSTGKRYYGKNFHEDINFREEGDAWACKGPLTVVQSEDDEPWPIWFECKEVSSHSMKGRVY